MRSAAASSSGSGSHGSHSCCCCSSSSTSSSCCAAATEPGGRERTAKAPASKSRYRPHEKTLILFLQGLVGVRTTIETTSNKSVLGTIVAVDNDGSLMLEDVETWFPQDDPDARSRSEILFLRHGRVRYVHIPPRLNVAAVVEERKRTSERAASRRPMWSQRAPAVPSADDSSAKPKPAGPPSD